MADNKRAVERTPFEIVVKGNLGSYKQSGDVGIAPEDIVSALRAYFTMHDKENPACPNPVAEGQITVKIRYPIQT